MAFVKHPCQTLPNGVEYALIGAVSRLRTPEVVESELGQIDPVRDRRGRACPARTRPRWDGLSSFSVHIVTTRQVDRIENRRGITRAGRVRRLRRDSRAGPRSNWANSASRSARKTVGELWSSETSLGTRSFSEDAASARVPKRHAECVRHVGMAWRFYDEI